MIPHAEKNGWFYPQETHISGGKNMRARTLHFVKRDGIVSLCLAWRYLGETIREVINEYHSYPCKKCQRKKKATE